MRENFKQSKYVTTPEEQIKIVFNDKYKDVSLIILNDDIRLLEYHTKEEYQKPNKTSNIYMAIFTTAHARLRLYKLLEILGERVLYMDTDSVIYIDDGSEECKKIEEMLGDMLGQLTNELGNLDTWMEEYVSAAPKDYAYELNQFHPKEKYKVKIKNKGIIMTAEAEEKITLNKKIEFVSNNNVQPEFLSNNQFVLNKVDNKIRVKQQYKMYDFEFNKRIPIRENENSIYSLPYGF